MKTSIILISALLLIAGLVWTSQEIVFNHHAPAAKYIILNKENSLYDQIYQEVSDQLLKEGIPSDYTVDILENGGDILSIILAQDYHYREIKQGCIEDEKQNAKKASYHAYIINKYGRDFYQKAERKAKDLEQQYQFTHLDSILTLLVDKAYSTYIIGDSLEVGELNKSLFDKFPVKLVISKSNQAYSSYFSSQESEKKLTVMATYKSFINRPRYALPPIALRIYFDTTKVRFPYAYIPIKTITLNHELDYDPMRDWK